MPFELGLAVALRQTLRRRHEWFVLEAKAHRLSKSLSDLGGRDELLHGGTPLGVVRALTNALARSRHRPTVPELDQIYADLVTAAGAIKKNLGTDSLYSARPFKEQGSAREVGSLIQVAAGRWISWLAAALLSPISRAVRQPVHGVEGYRVGAPETIWI